MLAKKSSKNQITLPKAIVTGFEDVDYFDVSTQNGRIILEPVRTRSGEEVRSRLETLGIIEPRERVDCPTLAHWIDQYVKGRSDVKSATATTYGNARRNVVAFFGGNTSIADITAHDTREFKAHLITPKSRGGEGLSENTARKRCSIAKQFFAAALRKRLISENPFVGLPCSVRENKTRFFFITRAMVMDGQFNA